MTYLENRYTDVPNKLLEKIGKTNFTGAEIQILIFIIRFTYGEEKESNQLSLKFISEGTGIDKRYISNSLSELIEDKVILATKIQADAGYRDIKINNNYKEWRARR